MNIQERTKLFHQFAQVLEDNAGNRLTLALINGILVTVDRVADRPTPDPTPAPPAPSATDETTDEPAKVE